MKDNKHENKTAYDAYLHSAELENDDDSLSYFSDSRKKAPAATSVAEKAPQRTAAPKAAKKALRLPKSQKLSHRKRKKETLPAGNYVILSAILVTAVIFALSLLTLATNDKQYSENENRYLATRPHISASSVADGKYMEDMENYLSDQFFARKSFVKWRTKIDLFFGKKEINDVYIGKNHYLFEKPATVEEKKLTKTTDSINSFTANHKKLHHYFALAPDASEVLPELLPSGAPTTDQSAQIKQVYSLLNKKIKTIDICTTLKNSEDRESLYYRSDHHWTTPAAEIAFKQIAANMQIDTGAVNYNSYAVTNRFYGTLASSSGLFNAKDTIFITVPDTKVQYVVTYVEENSKSASMFKSDTLEKKDKYEVFFGGNFSQVNIDTTLNSKQVLLVIKDSYANCLVPMLMPYYKSIIMIDPRYFEGDIDTVIKNNAVTDVLWLYNTNTFLKDTSIVNTIH